MKEKTIVYDVFPDMTIRLQDGRIVSLRELEPMVTEAGKLFGAAPWSKNENPRPTRILASISPIDGLCLHDFKTGISHRWASRQPVMLDPDFVELLKGLGAQK